MPDPQKTSARRSDDPTVVRPATLRTPGDPAPVELPAELAELPLADFLTTLSHSRLLDAAQFSEAGRIAQGADVTAAALAEDFVGRGWLTSWQSEQLLAGRTDFFLGKYCLLKKLGEGGMGAVYQARQGVTNRIVAIKVMAAHLVNRPDVIARFEREVQAAAAVSHPHVVTTFDADCAGQQHFLVMEYVAGQDLGEWLNEHGPLPAAWAAECIRQAALGLQHAHELGLVHRDLKPANLLVAAASLEEPPLAKILDMGLARFAPTPETTELTHSGQVFGTPQFMAPEQALNAKTADIRADVFSLGCTLFKTLTGENAYTGDTVTEQIAARFAGPPRKLTDIWPEAPAELAAIVDKSLRPQPAERYQTPIELAQALGAWLGTGSTMTSIPGALPRLAAAAKPSTVADWNRQDTVAWEAQPPVAPPTSGRWPWMAAMLATGALAVFLLVRSLLAPSSNPELDNGLENKNVASQKTTAEKAAAEDPVRQDTPLQKLDPPQAQPAAWTGLLGSDFAWGPPENLGAKVNTSNREMGATLTADELTLVYCGDGKLQICERQDRREPFGAPQPLPAAIQECAGDLASLSGDGLSLAFDSRGKEEDIWLSSRSSRDAPFGPPERLPAPINSPHSERAPLLSDDGLMLFLTTIRGGARTGQIRQYTRASRDASFGDETILSTEVNQSYSVANCLSPDGLALAVMVMGKRPFLSYVHTRQALDAPFGAGQPLGEVHGVSPGRGWLSPDGKRLYFHTREISGGHGDLDLWVSRRQAKGPAQP